MSSDKQNSHYFNTEGQTLCCGKLTQSHSNDTM